MRVSERKKAKNGTHLSACSRCVPLKFPSETICVRTTFAVITILLGYELSIFAPKQFQQTVLIFPFFPPKLIFIVGLTNNNKIVCVNKRVYNFEIDAKQTRFFF